MKAPIKAQIMIMVIVVYIRPFLWKASLSAGPPRSHHKVPLPPNEQPTSSRSCHVGQESPTFRKKVQTDSVSAAAKASMPAIDSPIVLAKPSGPKKKVSNILPQMENISTVNMFQNRDPADKPIGIMAK